MSVIVECCQNHNGSVEILHKMVEEASKAKATFCKIQTFFADDLSPSWRDSYDRLKGLELDWKAHAEFVSHCTNQNIIPMTSVYTDKYLAKLWDLGFRWIKIGSAQASDEELIKIAIMMGFKVIVSTGGQSIKDLKLHAPLAGLLHCVSEYPCSPNKANLIRMFEIQKYFPTIPYGFSSHLDPHHTETLTALKMASFLGASFIEVHFTVLGKTETKDGPVSLNISQLHELCEFDRQSFIDKLKACPSFGMLKSPQTQEECSLIEHYKTRWTIDPEKNSSPL